MSKVALLGDPIFLFKCHLKTWWSRGFQGSVLIPENCDFDTFKTKSISRQLHVSLKIVKLKANT